MRKELMSTNNLKEIRKIILSNHPADLASIFASLSKHKRTQIYKALSNDELASLFSYLDNPKKYLHELKVDKVSAILNSLEIDDLVKITSEFTDSEKKLYLAKISEEKQLHLKYIEKFQDDKVGKIIQTNFITVSVDDDVKDAMRKLIKESDDDTIIDPIFVVEGERLVGFLSLNDLIIARTPKLIKELMDENVVALEINDSIEKATNIIKEYSLVCLPVTDNGKLVGVITSDDALEIYSEIVDSQYASLAGVSSENLKKKSFLNRLLERLPWLIGLLFLSILITNVMSIFEEIIKKVTILIFFQTLILDMAGNVGTQTLAATIQRLVTNEKLSNKEIKTHIFKELKVNIINAIFLMGIAFGVCFIFVSLYGTTYSKLLISFTISLSIGVTLIVSSLFGTLLPIFFSKIKVNPAIASGPLITTINDIISVLIYFGLAGLLLNLF